MIKRLYENFFGQSSKTYLTLVVFVGCFRMLYLQSSVTYQECIFFGLILGAITLNRTDSRHYSFQLKTPAGEVCINQGGKKGDGTGDVGAIQPETTL